MVGFGVVWQGETGRGRDSNYHAHVNEVRYGRVRCGTGWFGEVRHGRDK